MWGSKQVPAALLVVAVSLLSGCSAAAQGSPSGHASMHMSPGMDMSSMAGMDMSQPGPSEAARMICSPEIRAAVKRTLQLDSTPRPTHTWKNRVFTCTYRIGGRTLMMSVDDAQKDSVGAAYFAKLRQSLPGARRIRGLENFGFPAVQTAAGQVAFLKDGKSLLVDASDLAARALPAGLSKEQAAYGVAAAVIACWTE
jgi:hypothetical protein